MAKNKPIFELIGLALDAIYQENLCRAARVAAEKFQSKPYRFHTTKAFPICALSQLKLF